MSFFNNFTKLFYCFSMMIPLSSKPVIFALVPTGRSVGVAIPAINPEILNWELSKSITTKAYGVYFSKPAGATVMIV
jgi:hypothetical protein